MNARHDARLVPAAAGAWAAAACGVLQGSGVALGLAGALVAAGAAAGAVRKVPRALALILLLAGAVALAAAASVVVAEDRAAPLAAAAGERVEILAIARADAVATASAGGLDSRVDARVISIDGEAVAIPVTLIGSEVTGVEVGDTIAATVTVPSDLAPLDAVLWRPTVSGVSEPSGWRAVVPTVRMAFRDAVAELPDRTRGLVLGMVIGDTTQMPQEQAEAMRVSGLTHLTAVSGSHFAIVAAAVAWFTTRLVPGRALRAVLLCAAGLAFTALVLPQPSVVRALTMVVAISIGALLGRRASALPALASGVTVLVVIDPVLSTSYGFAMSVAAVAALALWAPRLASRLERLVWPSVARLVAIPTAAHLAVAPIIVLFDPGIGLYSTPANLLAVPFVAPITVVGLVAVGAAVLLPAAAGPLVWFLGLCAEPVATVARATAAAPGAWLTWREGWAGAALLAVVAAAAVVVTTAHGTAVRVAVASLAIVAIALGLGPQRFGVLLPGSSIEEWAAVVCDVGQGSAALIRAGPHSAVVIDTGQSGSGAPACLARYGVESVELLVLSHPHADHDGAVSEILAAAPVREAWVSRAGADGASSAAAVLASAGVPVRVPQSGTVEAVGDATVTVLSTLHATGVAATDSDLNDGSIVVAAMSGGVVSLVPGDLETAGQSSAVETVTAAGPVDLLVVPHHGSATQVEAYANAVSAAVAVVSVGADNDYGHPAASALDLYSPHVGALLRTDQCGDVVVLARDAAGGAAGSGVDVATGCPIDVGG